MGTMTDQLLFEKRPRRGIQHRSEVEGLLAIQVEVVRSIVGIAIPIEVHPLRDVQNQIGLMMLIVALQMIAIWMMIVICSPMILKVEVLLTAKKALRFAKVNCLTVIVGLAAVVVVVVEVGKALAMQIMHHAARLLLVMICVNLAVVIFESPDEVKFENQGAVKFENQGAVMFESLDGFRTAVVRKVIVAVTTVLAVAMAGTMAIAGVAAVVMMEAATTVAEVDEMTGRLAVAEIWDADAIWVARDEDARFSRPVRWSKAHSMAFLNSTHGDMVFSVIQRETTRRKTPTHLSLVRLLKNTSCDRVSSFEAMSGRAREIRGLDSAKLNSSMGLLQRST